MSKDENIPTGYKDSPLGVIPQEWEVKRLGEICSNGDYGINAAATEHSAQLPTYLRITDIDDNGKYSKNKIASVDSPQSNDYILKDGDIVFARTGATVGKTYLYDKNDGILVFAGFLIRFSPRTDILLPYYLKSITDTKYYWDWVTMVSMRSGQPGINSKEYSTLLIAVPPLEEQRRIAEILGCWDEAIERQGRMVELLTTRKRALMQRLLSPKPHWKKTKLGEMAKIKKGIQVNKIELDNEGKYPTINGGIEPSGYSDNYNTSENTITISEGGNSCGYVGYMTTKFWCGGHCYAIFCNELIDKIFLYQLLKCNETEIMALRVGSGLPNIQITPLQKFNLIIPPLAEQKSIAEKLSTADAEIDLARRRLDLLRTQKRALMQQLLTGKKRVKYDL